MRYLPCDFHPVLLILGNASQLRHVSEILDNFAATGEAVDLGQSGIFSADTQVILRELDTATGARAGLWLASGGRKPTLDWCLTRAHAKEFADTVMKAATDDAHAGSATLECETLNEIRVKVSFGEFEDPFLLGDAW